MTRYYCDCRLDSNAVQIRRQNGGQEPKISFKRTARVPDNKDETELPPDLGDFPLYKVQNYGKLRREMIAKGSVFMPTYPK